MLLNSHNSERSDRRFALHTWSGGTNKSKPVKVLSGVLSTYCSNYPHIKHVFIIGGVQLKYIAGAREDDSFRV